MPHPHNVRRLVFIAVVAGLLLRLPTVLAGAPRLLLSPGDHPDEPTVCTVVTDFPFNYFDNHNFVYGTAWQYMIGLLLVPVKLIHLAWMSNEWQSEDSYYHLAAVVARLASVAAGTVAIYLTWLLGRRLFGRVAGATAAALLSVSLYHCNNSAFATLDVPMSCLLVLLFLVTIRAVEVRTPAAWAVCGAVAGFLMGTKVVAVFFALVPLFVIAVKWIEERRDPAYIRAAAVYVGVASAVLFVTTPHMFVHPVDFWRYILTQKRGWYDPAQTSLLARASQALRGTQTAIGAPLIIAFLGGAVLSLRRKPAIPAVALLLLAIYYLFWGGFLVPRYVIAISPLFCLFAGLFLATLIESHLVSVRIAGIGLLAAALALSAYQCVAGIVMRLDDTRPRAAAYIARTTPAGTTVGVLATSAPGHRFSWRYPVIDYRKYDQTAAVQRPALLVVTSYDVEDIEHERAGPNPGVRDLYEALFHSGHSGYRLVADFAPASRVPIEFPPPEIWIYRLQK